ncbi:hypothetical protein QAD02_007772 [Eretmocerus hayati]|uniref:Uncharacterized protein n=1 Tax=Eretmocerus hayati TaxID=131215 RepID=A0ACC2N4K6_9HYME|nr:hypothetical protein QAD02_007772 [Eretmocerus hayati]
MKHIRQDHVPIPQVTPTNDQIQAGVIKAKKRSLPASESLKSSSCKTVASEYQHRSEIKELKESVFDSSCKMMTSLKISSKFNHSGLSIIAHRTENLLSEISNAGQSALTNFLVSLNVDMTPQVNSFMKSFRFDDSIGKLSTQKSQSQAMEKFYKQVASLEYPLGYRLEGRSNKLLQRPEYIRVYETFQYVSVIKTLELVLPHEEIRKGIASEQKSTDVNNKLGNKVRAHKIGMFYFVIQNLPKHLNSLLGGIHVLGIACTADIAKYGVHKILEPFFNDLKKLESNEGVPLKFGQGEYVLRATISAICGDGLAAHQLFNLKGSGVSRFCRLCLISRDEFHKDINCSSISRTRENYSEQLKILERQKTKGDLEEKKTEYGLNGDCAFHQSKYFHFTECKVFDRMHDILEGSAQLTLKCVIYHFIHDKNCKLTINMLNNRIDPYDYGFTDIKDKPSSSFDQTQFRDVEDHKVRQTAAQTWCLMRIFPFLVSDLGDGDNEHLRLILLQNRIIEPIFPPITSKSLLPYLRETILDFNRLFKKLFSHVSPINELHHILHYCECILFSGPSRFHNCFRFGAKHREFTKYGSVCQNYKNIPKSMISLAQTKQSAVWGGQKLELKSFGYAQEIDGDALLKMSKENLEDLGIKAGPRIKLLEIIRKASPTILAVGHELPTQLSFGSNIDQNTMRDLVNLKDHSMLTSDDSGLSSLRDSTGASDVNDEGINDEVELPITLLTNLFTLKGRKWITEWLAEQSDKQLNLLESLDDHALEDGERRLFVQVVVDQFIKANDNDYHPDCSLTEQLAEDIVVFFPKQRIAHPHQGHVSIRTFYNNIITFKSGYGFALY